MTRLGSTLQKGLGSFPPSLSIVFSSAMPSPLPCLLQAGSEMKVFSLPTNSLQAPIPEPTGERRRNGRGLSAGAGGRPASRTWLQYRAMRPSHVDLARQGPEAWLRAARETARHPSSGTSRKRAIMDKRETPLEANRSALPAESPPPLHARHRFHVQRKYLVRPLALSRIMGYTFFRKVLDRR